MTGFLLIKEEIISFMSSLQFCFNYKSLMDLNDNIYKCGAYLDVL